MGWSDTDRSGLDDELQKDIVDDGKDWNKQWNELEMIWEAMNKLCRVDIHWVSFSKKYRCRSLNYRTDLTSPQRNKSVRELISIGGSNQLNSKKISIKLPKDDTFSLTRKYIAHRINHWYLGEQSHVSLVKEETKEFPLEFEIEWKTSLFSTLSKPFGENCSSQRKIF